MLNDLAFFPIVTTTIDDLGQELNAEEFTRQVFCGKKSPGQKEVFLAGQKGLKPSMVLITSIFDYLEETKVQHNGKILTIYRTFERPDETVELYCEVRTGGN